MKKIVTFNVILILSGCATEIISSNARSVTVSAIYMNKGDAFKIADSECNKHMRVAKHIPRDGEMSTLWTFDCVDP